MLQSEIIITCRRCSLTPRCSLQASLLQVTLAEREGGRDVPFPTRKGPATTALEIVWVFYHLNTSFAISFELFQARKEGGKK